MNSALCLPNKNPKDNWTLLVVVVLATVLWCLLLSLTLKAL